MFVDRVTIKLGDTPVKIRRLTVREIREARHAFSGKLADEAYDAIIRDHVTTADGDPLDPSELSVPQMRQLVTELVGIPEGNGVSDFIGLLC